MPKIRTALTIENNKFTAFIQHGPHRHMFIARLNFQLYITFDSRWSQVEG